MESSDEDSLFVSTTSAREPKIKQEPGLEDASTVPATTLEPAASNSKSPTPISVPDAVPNRSRPNQKSKGKSKKPAQPSRLRSVTPGSDRIVRSTSEILNNLYEGNDVIPMSATPELVLNDKDDDEIVQEFPVFYSTEYIEKLYLLQYPTRSAMRPLVDSKGTGVLDSRIKPVSQVIEVDLPIETSQFYDREKGDQWGGLDKQTFSGVAKPVQGYMIGVFKDSELHLNPIHATAQLRPQFQYISQPPTPIGDALSSTSVIDNEKENAEKNKVSGPKAVHLTAKIVGDNAPSFSGALTARKKMEDEEFVGMDWYDRDSEESWSTSDKLVAERKNELISTMTSDEYIANISSPYVDPLEASRIAAEQLKKQQQAALAARQAALRSSAPVAKPTPTQRVPVRRAATAKK